MQVKITHIERNAGTNARGSFTRTTIKTDKTGGKFLSSFDDNLADLNEGDNVNISITENGKFTNFSLLPDGVFDGTREEMTIKEIMDTILTEIRMLRGIMEKNHMFVSTDKTDYPYPSVKEATAMVKDSNFDSVTPPPARKEMPAITNVGDPVDINPEDIPF